MAQLNLQKLLMKKDSPGAALSKLLARMDEPFEITGPEGELLFSSGNGNKLGEKTRLPILYGGTPVGWITARKDSQLNNLVAPLMSALYAHEMEKRALAAEVLDKYREINLLYRISDRLITSPEPQSIAAMALNEACPLLQVTSGVVVLKQPGGNVEVIASCGQPSTLKKGALAPGGIIDRVLRSGNGEMDNGVKSAPFFQGIGDQEVSILCAPLKSERQVSGAMILVNFPARPFSAGDLKLLNIVAMQAGPVIEIVQLHQFELEKARIERDLQNAHKVQADLLPRSMPKLPGWEVAAFWQPARLVGGDFYDFIHFPDGKLGFVIADVSGKGMPAALVMANTRSILRAVAISHGHGGMISPGKILEQANNLLAEDMPKNMFVTCLVAILEPQSGEICFANAGHNLPYQRTAKGVIELRATGLPLGLFSDMDYEVKQMALQPGESLFLYSDGIPEAHNPAGEMFDSPRMRQSLEDQPLPELLSGEELIQNLMRQLIQFTGPSWQQEDDVTMLAIRRCAQKG